MKKPIKLAIVDDQQLFRKGLISLFSEYEELQVVMEAANGKEFVEKLNPKAPGFKKPDIVLLDLEMPEMDGLEVSEYLQGKFPDIKVLALTMHNEEEIIIHLVEKGARGFLLKEDSIDTIIDALYAVTETGYYFNDRISKAMVKGLVRNKKIKPSFGTIKLTDREIEILRLICKEYTTGEIAEKLFLSPRTVDGHRDKILQKIKARNVAGMVIYAMKNGLME